MKKSLKKGDRGFIEADRRGNRKSGRLASKIALRGARPDQEGGSRNGRRDQMAQGIEPSRRGPGLVARRDRLHGRDLQGHGEVDFRQGSLAGGPGGLFNSSLEGSARRAIDFGEGDVIDGEAFQALIPAAVTSDRSMNDQWRPVEPHVPC